jgi:hypothetical protein
MIDPNAVYLALELRKRSFNGLWSIFKDYRELFFSCDIQHDRKRTSFTLSNIVHMKHIHRHMHTFAHVQTKKDEGFLL